MLSILVISRSAENMRLLIGSVVTSRIDESLELLVAWNGKSDPPVFDDWEKNIRVNYYQIMPYNFARNNNALAKHAEGRYLLFINDDIILDRDCLQRALNEIKKPEIGIVGANLRYPDGRIQHVGVFFDDKRMPYHRYKGIMQHDDSAVIADMFVPALTGAFLLIRRDEFMLLKFDERFSVAGEDICLSLAYRKRFARGVLYCADATAIHHENVTRRETNERETPEADQALIQEYAAGDLDGHPLTSVKRPKVRIVTEKEGWIMHRKAAEIRNHFGEASIKINEDWPEAEIHYYINYGYFNKRPASGVIIANFTHFDPDLHAEKYVEVAYTVDHCTSVSELTTHHLQELGIRDSKITTIRVGADVNFRPKLMLGIAGRPYKGGRKGEDLLRGLLDDPEIMRHCQIVGTNPDWGVPTLALADPSDFYRLIDYLLITARIEGGPVPFMEALACGTLSIAPPIGVIPEFPHISYATGSVESLKDTVCRLIGEMNQTRGRLAQSIRRQTWAGWSVRHEKIFRRLLPAGRFS